MIFDSVLLTPSQIFLEKFIISLFISNVFMVKSSIEKTSVILFSEIFLCVSKLYKITSVFSLFSHKFHNSVDNVSENFQKIPKLKFADYGRKIKERTDISERFLKKNNKRRIKI